DKQVLRDERVVIEGGRVSAAVDAGVKLGDLVFHAQIIKHVYGVNDRLSRREINIVVHLMTDAVNRNAPALQSADEVEEELALGRIGGVEIIDEQLGVRVDIMRDLERSVDKLGPDDVEPWAAAESVGLARINYFVDNVPGVDVVLVVGHDCADVVLHAFQE